MEASGYEGFCYIAKDELQQYPEREMGGLVKFLIYYISLLTLIQVSFHLIHESAFPKQKDTLLVRT